MGMNILQDGERIPFIEVKRAGEEGKLLEKLNNFFSGRVQSRIINSELSSFLKSLTSKYTSDQIIC